MPGVAAMKNVHPLFVHFPIALLNAFFPMELLGFLLRKEGMRNAASWMLYLGTLGAAAAVIAGLQAASTASHNEVVHAIMERHEGFGITVLVLSGLLSAWRLIVRGRFPVKAQLAHLAVAFITVAIMTFGADLGGMMVYKYGVGGSAVVQPEGHAHGGSMPMPMMEGEGGSMDHGDAHGGAHGADAHDSAPHRH